MRTPRTDLARNAQHESGFTIVETLVALFVFALSGVALMTMQAQSASALSRVETRALASLIAENNLVDALARRSAPELGVRSGEVEVAGKTWRWTVETAATNDRTTYRLKSVVADPSVQSSDVSVTAYAVAGGI